MLTPRGSVVDPAASILDSAGHLVWTVGGYQQIYNLIVHEHVGQQYLKYWAGNGAVGGHGMFLYPEK
jgi:hypothetical protein